MNGFIRKATAAWCLAGGLVVGAGCCGYQNLVDPCYPDRYNSVAQKEVIEPIGTQVHNGHILDQTIWNWMFEPNSDKLTPAGQEHLTNIVRHRPAPDPCVYVATAEADELFHYDPVNPAAFADARKALDGKRVKAVEGYLGAQAAGRNLTFQVMVHDPAEPYLPAAGIGGSVRTWYGAFTGTNGGAGGGGGGGAAGGGAAPPAGR